MARDYEFLRIVMMRTTQGRIGRNILGNIALIYIATSVLLGLFPDIIMNIFFEETNAAIYKFPLSLVRDELVF